MPLILVWSIAVQLDLRCCTREAEMPPLGLPGGNPVHQRYVARANCRCHLLLAHYKYLPNPTFIISMKVFYPLKTSEPLNYVQPLVKYIEQIYDMETAYSFKPLLGKICELRTKVTASQVRPDMPDDQLDKTIEMYSAYTKYALIIMKRFNWNSERGKAVEGISVMWRDSFQPKHEYSKNTITFDVFSAFYNLAVMYFMRALKLSQVDLDASRKEAMNKAKYAAFLVKEMKEKYYVEFNNSGFNDTQFAHLDIIENLCLGLIYKCLYNTFRSSEYKLGINKIASICQVANKHFLKAYSVAANFFMNPSGISDKTKTELLSIAYIESLYFDVLANIKYAKYYAYLLEKDATKIPIVIAYERKAQRLLDIGLKNQSVDALFSQNKAQKTEFLGLQEELALNLQKNLARNKEIYKQPEIKEEAIPPNEDFPPEWVVKLVLPPNLVMENEGEFAKLLTEEAYGLSMELVGFSESRKVALESSIKKLDDEIEKLFNDSYVNFYLQMDSQNQAKTVPRTLQDKILEVKKKGGLNKLENDLKSMKDSQASASKNFMQLRQIISDEEYFDGQKRSQFGNRWSRPPSSVANKEYLQRIENLEKKAKQAQTVDDKISEKYQRNLKYIEIMNSNNEAIINSLPKPDATQFMENNKEELTQLKSKYENIKVHRENLAEIGHQIVDRLVKKNYPILANTLLTQNLSKEDIFKTVFKEVEDLISQFNDECKVIKEEATSIAGIAMSLNSKNKDQQKNKREFEEVINRYNEIAQMYGEFSQTGSFYSKLNDHLSKLISETEDFAFARMIGAEELEKSMNNKGGGFSNNLPDMYPNQKKEEVPQFVPPPPPAFISQNSPWQLLDRIFGSGPAFTQNNQNINQSSHGFMQTNPFSGGFQPLNFPSNPFDGPVFPSGFGSPNQNQNQNRR